MNGTELDLRQRQKTCKNKREEGKALESREKNNIHI